MFSAVLCWTCRDLKPKYVHCKSYRQDVWVMKYFWWPNLEYEFNCINHCITHDGYINFVRFSKFGEWYWYYNFKCNASSCGFSNNTRESVAQQRDSVQNISAFVMFLCGEHSHRLFTTKQWNQSQPANCVHLFASRLFKVHVVGFKQWRAHGDCDLLCGKRFCTV